MPHPLPATLFAEAALVEGRVQPRVRLELDAAGVIAAVHTDTAIPPGAERIAGLVVPGLANVHSHAFQRAMAGLAERGGPAGDDFWSWREAMYRFLSILTPDDVQAVAAQLYVECLRHGYTAVGEFHYLHNAPDGRPYDDPAEMSLRIVAAADAAGIGLTLLPSLYRHGNFGGVASGAGQRRFLLTPDLFAALCERLAPLVRVGVAPHSLRAVTPEELHRAVEIATTISPDAPIHLHVAEQAREVADCLAWSGTRPLQYLLDHAPVGPRWCVIHATHATVAEAQALARSGAVLGLCPSTEANLGDGVFPLAPFLAADGAFGIGSDSNVGTSPVEELRWLEYVRRLETQRRNVSDTRPGASVAASLLAHAAQAGARALARPAGTIACGALADLVVLDTEHPTLVGREAEALLDAWVFSGNDTPVRHVMVGGHWVVRDGQHRQSAPIGEAFRRTLRGLRDAA